MLKFLVAVLTGLPLLAAHAQTPAKANAGGMDDAVTASSESIASGHAAAALPRLDAIIRRHALDYANVTATIRVARSPQESMHYALSAALAKQPVKVIFSNWAEAYYLKSLAHAQLAQDDAADTALSDALALAPNNSRYLLKWAERLMTAKKYSPALTAYDAAEQAVELAPEALRATERAQAIRGAAAAMLALGQTDRARDRLRSGHAVLPDDKGITMALSEIERDPRSVGERLF